MLLPARPASAQSEPATSLLVKLVPGLSDDQRDAVFARHGGTHVRSITALRLHVIAVPADEQETVRARYAADPHVASVEENRRRQSEAIPTDLLYPSQWALPKIGWESVFGAIVPLGVSTVAVLDTGIDAQHPDLTGKLIPGTSMFDRSRGLTDPSGHGTWVAGLIAADTGSPEGIAGVAFEGVRLMPVTVLDANGLGQDSDVIAGVLWAVDHGADVVLMAFSNPGFSANLQEAIDYAWSKGAVIVAAVGNDATSEPTFPAGDRGVMGVAATDQTDGQAYFSNEGQSVFIAAPGVEMVTTDIGRTYLEISGTSMAAAVVAGVAAFMKAVDPALSNGVIVGRIARNADPAGTRIQTGNGRVNMARALEDTSTDPVQPAGADPVGDGGPFVGPYRAAARTFTVTFAGTGAGAITINTSTGANPGTVNAPVSCGGTGTATTSQTISRASGSSCAVTLSNNSATGSLTATPSADSSMAGWGGASNITGCTGTTTPCNFSVTGANPALTVTFNSQVTNFKVEAAAGGAIGAQTAGTAFSIKITAQNASNGTVTGFTGKATITSTGTLSAGGGLSANFVNGVLTTSVTISNTGSFTISATGVAPNAGATGTSAAFTVNAGALHHFVVEAAGGGSIAAQTAGTAFNIRVTAQDLNNNTVTTFTGAGNTATITSTGTLTAGGGTTATFTNGVLASHSVTVSNTGSFTITATNGGASGTSNTFTVNAGAAAAVVLAGSTADLASGASRSYTATVQDAFGNTVTSFNGSVTFSQTAGVGTVNGVGAVNAVSGVATKALTGVTAGSVTIAATASSITSNAVSFTVVAGAHAKFAIATIGTQTAGVAFAITITAQDANDNTVTSFAGTANLTTNGGPIAPSTSGAFSAGVRTESVTLTLAGTGRTITATRTGGTETGTSTTFTVNPGAVTKFAVSTIASPQTAGVAFSVTITAQDANDNTATSFVGTVGITTNAGTATPSVSGAFTGGVRTQSVSVTQAGTGKTLTVTRTGGTETGTSNTFTVNPGALDHFDVEAAGGGAIGTQTAGAPFNIAITARDAGGNVVTAFNGGGNKVSVSSTGTLSVGGGTTASFASGVLASHAVTVTNTGSFTITATGVGGVSGINGTSNAFTVAPGTPSSSTSSVIASPTSLEADGTTTSAITVTVRDGLNNVVSGKTVTLAQGAGTSTISAASGPSDASGVVTFTVKSTVAQTVTYTATDATDGVVIAQTATVTFRAGAVSAARSTVVASPTSVVADGTTLSTITVTLRDVNDNPVSGKTVTLAQGAGSSTISAASGSSSATGVVTFTVKSTVAQAVTYTATDATDGLVITQTATVVFTAGAVDAGHSTVVASPTSLVADGTTLSTITVTLRDANDNPVSGKTVTLAQGGGSSTISAASGPSSASGVVTFAVKSTVAQAVTYTATDSTDGVAIAQTATVTYTAGGTSAATSTIAGTGPVTANGVAASTVTIVLRDATNNPRPGITPTFSATGSTNALSACSATNALGVATCGLTSTKAEGKTLSLVSPVAVTGNTVTFVAGPPAAGNSTITATSPVTADGLAVSTVTITVKDAFDNPVTGAAPLVAVTGSGNVMGACPSTNASGTSTCSLASTTAEAKTVSVTSPVAIAGVTVTFVAAAISNNAVGNTDGSSAGSAGGAVAGNTGGAATGNTGALVSPNFGVTTPTSSSNGVVPGGNSSMATAAPMPPSAGAAPSAPEPASAVTVTVGPPVAANSVIVATSPVTADGLASSNVLITLRDASNNPVANVVPSFTATGAGNVVGGCSATNALGTATCRLASTRAESKTLAITSPVSVRGGTVRFTPGSAASATIAGTGPVPADGVRTSTITITLRDAFDNPLSGTTPAFSASGSSNVVGPCSPSDQSGHSTCTLASTVAEEKTLFITTPVIATGATVRFLPGAADHLVLTPTRATLTLGESQRYTAEARDPNNNDLGDITAGTSFSISPDGTCLGSVCSAASAGPHVVTASRQGMTGTTTMQIVYGFAGPHAPYAPPSQKSFRLRSTIALRWHYTASRGVAVASANAAPMVTIAAATCDGAEATTAPAVTDRRSGGYLYDPATHTWQYEWKTAGSGAGCYAIRITSGQTGQTAGPFVIKLAE